MNEGGMSELYSDAMNKAMPIDNRRNAKKKENGRKNAPEMHDDTRNCYSEKRTKIISI